MYFLINLIKSISCEKYTKNKNSPLGLGAKQLTQI
jgi:hypothetical protein